MKGTVGTGLGRVQSFAELFAAGVQARLERDVAVESAEVTPTSTDALAGEVGDGALIARILWDENGESQTGCLLWMGQIGLLLGDENRPAGSFSEDEVATLDASLRLSIEEAAESEMPFEWSALEKVNAGGLASALREGGATSANACARAVVRLGDAHQAFLLVPSDAAAAAAQTSAATPAPAPAGATDDTRTADTVAEMAAHVSDLHLAGLRNLEHLLEVRLPLTIRLGSTRMPLDDVLRLAPGSVVELDRSEDEPLEVLANGRVIARGEVVVVDERFGLRITEIGSAEERIRATI